MKCHYIILATVSLLSVVALAQSNPIPTINGPVAPQAVAPGSAGFTLTVRGANFVSGAVVNWNGSSRSTTFVSAGQLQAQIPASDVAVAGSALITVTNPAPGGGLSSSSFGTVEIHQPVATMMLTEPKKYRGTTGGSDLYTADLNSDSKQDLAVTGSRGISVFTANGDGSFTKSASLLLQNDPEGIGFGDFNGDGKEDFAFSIPYRRLAFVALGDGTGKFQLSRGFGKFQDPGQTAAGDFNRDGKLDLAVEAVDGLYVLLGNGDGTFQTQQIAASVDIPTYLTLGDFNGDGILDFAYVDGRTSLLSVALGNGDGTFQPPIESQQACCAEVLGMVDFNGDGNLDFVTFGSGGPVPISVLLGNGDGTFQPPQFYSTGLMQAHLFIAAGDFNSDGNTDVLSYGESVFEAGFLAGNGDGTFQRVSRFTVPGSLFKLLPVVGDFNSDGLLDFAVGVGDGSEVFLQAPQ